MKKTFDLTKLDWKLTGWTPYSWMRHPGPEISDCPSAEVTAISAAVPGSVQRSIRDAGVIPDWNLGINHRQCEWVENRHWVYETRIPDDWIEPGKHVRLKCLGLDYSGWVFLNNQEMGRFVGTHLPYEFDFTDHLIETNNVMRIIFDISPRWLGQYGNTSEMRDWKPRFNYSWDWTTRLVQIGIWDDLLLETWNGSEISEFRCYTDANAESSTGRVVCAGQAGPDGKIKVVLSRDGQVVAEKEVSAAEFNQNGVEIPNVSVELWWPNLEGDQPLYDLKAQLLDESGAEIDSVSRRVGFREVKWLPCEDTPPGAGPWLCNVNGKSIFIQGANWVPIRANFADVTEADYRKRLELYKDLGANILRVWGGARLEKEVFYNLCDELGIMVWQELPLSSSSIDSYPPDDQEFVDQAAEIAKSYMARRQHHASLIMWCGGNELSRLHERIPLDDRHPLLKRVGEIAREMDPTRRYLPSSPASPKFCFELEDAGKGVHWNVHGPWKPEGDLETEWRPYWEADDSLFRAETGAPGASSVEIIRETAGDCDVMPVSIHNPLWRRNCSWWIQEDLFQKDMGREPASVEEYVAWSQERQAKALTISVGSAKRRFPRCGGIILWMGHDCYPCGANTSIIDFNGDPKPAALAIKNIWRSKAG